MKTMLQTRGKPPVRTNSLSSSGSKAERSKCWRNSSKPQTSFVEEWRELAKRAQTRERANGIRLTHRTQYGSRKEKDPRGIHTREDLKSQKDQSTSRN